MPFVLSGIEDLLAAAGGHPFVRSTLRYRNRNVHGWSSRVAIVWLAEDERPDRDGVSVAAFGPPAQVVDLFGQVTHLLPEEGYLTVPRDAADGLPHPVHFTHRSRWGFRAMSTAPPEVPGEADVEVLPVEAHSQAADLLDRANPTASARPGSPWVRLWAGMRDDAGRLVAVAADTSYRGVGHTSAVATDPGSRGRGLGAAVTCWLARRQVSEFGLATLGFYADNEPARRMYDRLGYGYAVDLTSGSFSLRCPPGR